MSERRPELLAQCLDLLARNGAGLLDGATDGARRPDPYAIVPERLHPKQNSKDVRSRPVGVHEHPGSMYWHRWVGNDLGDWNYGLVDTGNLFRVIDPTDKEMPSAVK